MDRTTPKTFIYSQRGNLFDPQVLGYGTALFSGVNGSLRGGNGTGFSLASNLLLGGRTSTPAGTLYHDNIYFPPPNAGHTIDTVLVPQNPVIVIDAVGIVVSSPILFQSTGADATASIKLEVGIGRTNTVDLSFCSMFIGATAALIEGTTDLSSYSYPVAAMAGTDFDVSVDNAAPTNVAFGGAPVSLAATLAVINGFINPGATATTNAQGRLVITSNGSPPTAQVRITGGVLNTLELLGLVVGQQSGPTGRRPFTNNAGNGEFGGGANDANFAMNEQWPAGQTIGRWFAIDGDSKKALLSAPVGGVSDDRILLRTTLVSAGSHATTVGQITVYLHGYVLPAY